ncbi:predicted protein [Chaetomium globosum CBS 148.51]|uniref:Uncharacterized protein n=1 Tax=Chaetomium globosum (strain ATCC 6205 / CBS 148.51 / DSM 1962 / NBRC 6347 / NRRL 1970) TaxID=306901 RepID=Q2H348_CHAGB|nr:uncharacterized protein CHGG_03798 [Chaetomium globosum CBS 148.51]EAQ87179.1 predicted protein [Chaetomium globosum CBS 148.51]
MAAPAQSTSERGYESRPTWQQLFNDGMQCYYWLRSDQSSKGNCLTTKSKSCLVATVCFDDDGYYRVFHCTIPRGQFENYMWSGALKTPQWWAAASTPIQPETLPNPLFHAEDGALFLCESTMGTLVPGPGCEGVRMLVCGLKGGTSKPGKTKLCAAGSPKRPDSKTVAERLNVRFLGTGSPSDLDAADALLHQQQLQQQQQQRPSSNSSNESGYSGGSILDSAYIDPSNGDIVASDGTRGSTPGRPHQDQGSRSRRSGAPSSNSMSLLTQGMSTLSMGRGGNARHSRGPQNGGTAAQSGGFQVSPPRGTGPQSANRSTLRQSSGSAQTTSRQSSTVRLTTRPSSSGQSTARDPRRSAGREERRG